MKLKSFLKITFFFVCHLCLVFVLLTPSYAKPPGDQLFIYTWYDLIPTAAIKQFEEETGIKVQVDYFESNQILEAQLLTGHAGYDVVFPGAYPYLARQVPRNLYQPLDKSKIPNWENLQKKILEKLRRADSQNDYAAPFIWGTLGIAYNKSVVKERLPKQSIDSWAVLFDPHIVQQLAPCGVYLLNETVDVFSQMNIYLGFDPNTTQKTEVQKSFDRLRQIRPYIRKFANEAAIEDLIQGDACLIQSNSSDVAAARRRNPERGQNLSYVIPKEGTIIWVDTMAIPKGAPHPDHAHKFINFLLRPEISAMVTNISGHRTANVAAQKHIEKKLLNDPIIFPPDLTIESLSVNTTDTWQHERYLTRLMMRLKTGR